MRHVLKFVAYLYLKVLLVIGYDYLFEKEDIIGKQESLLAPQTQKMLYAASTLVVMPLLDTIIMAIPLYLSLKRRGSMKGIMLAITFFLEFVVYYFAIGEKEIVIDIVLKSVFSVLVFLILYRKEVFGSDLKEV